MSNNKRCPKCGEGVLQTWQELSDDEREVVRRLPGATDYEFRERQARHRWCARCWHEETGNSEHTA